MPGETYRPAAFYGTRRGAVAASLLRARLAALWPDLRGLNVLGIGYGVPYLRLWREQAARCIALNPPQTGLSRWAPRGLNLCCSAAEDSLPFPDLSFDRILLVHGLEAADNVRGLLREVWRVLKDDGQLLVIVPNRRGWWAHVETTPFGHGQPYSAGQVSRLLAGSLFRVEHRETALFVPPLNLRLALRAAPLIERVGSTILPQLGGVTITIATKYMYAVLPIRQARRRLVIAEAA